MTTFPNPSLHRRGNRLVINHFPVYGGVGGGSLLIGIRLVRQLHSFYPFPFRFVVEAVDSRDHVAAFEFFVWNVAFRVTGDGCNVGRIVQIYFLSGQEAVDHKVLRIPRIFTIFSGKPFYRVAFFRAFSSGRGYFLRTAVVHVGIGRNKCRGFMIVFLKAVSDTIGVPYDFIRGPEAIAFHVVQGTGEFHFSGKVGSFHRASHVLADIQVDVVSIFVPPFSQRDIVCGWMTDLPVYLGNIVVNPFLFGP